MHWRQRFLLVLAIPWAANALASDSLYAASVRSPVGDSAHAIAGNLYTVNLSTGVFALVGSLRVAGSPIGLTGLADHPTTGKLYGITALASPNYPRSLVTVDAATAEATVVGDLGAAGTDIAFTRGGTLFVWLRETSQLATVDLGSGKAMPLGTPGHPSEAAGLAIDANGRAFLAATGATGTLDVIDTTTGMITRGPALRGAPFPGGINSLTISPGGALLAVNTNFGSPATTVLVRIQPATGEVAQLGPLPNDTDALVFTDPPWSAARFLSSRDGLVMLAALAAVGLALAFFLASRRKQRTTARS